MQDVLSANDKMSNSTLVDLIASAVLLPSLAHEERGPNFLRKTKPQ